jgi:hypothetical protein
VTNHTVRLYTAIVSLMVLFALWIIIAAHPWRSSPKNASDQRVFALRAREKHLRHEALLVRRTVQRRWLVYGRRLRERQGEIAMARRRHEAELAAAQRAAAARAAALAAIARARTAAAAASSVAARAPAAAAGPTPAAVPAAPSTALPPLVVTLPPKVRVVSLPPITVSKSS